MFPGVRNVTIVNNTLHGHGTCLFIRWSGARNVTLANNAVYCPSATALDASLGPAVVRSNYVAGSGARLDSSRFLAGGSATAAFVDPAGRNLAGAELGAPDHRCSRSGTPTGLQRDGANAPVRRRRLPDGRSRLQSGQWWPASSASGRVRRHPPRSSPVGMVAVSISR
jgi:hypothetical protein